MIKKILGLKIAFVHQDFQQTGFFIFLQIKTDFMHPGGRASSHEFVAEGDEFQGIRFPLEGENFGGIGLALFFILQKRLRFGGYENQMSRTQGGMQPFMNNPQALVQINFLESRLARGRGQANRHQAGRHQNRDQRHGNQKFQQGEPRFSFYPSLHGGPGELRFSIFGALGAFGALEVVWNEESS